MKNIDEIAWEAEGRSNRKNTQKSFLSIIKKVLNKNKIQYDLLQTDNLYIGQQRATDYRFLVIDINGRKVIWHFVFAPETKREYEQIQYFKE